MKTFENLGIKSTVINDELIIRIPVQNLISAFNFHPDNFGESKVKEDKQEVFAEFVAEHILEECDSETGNSTITQAFDKVFELLLEGFEDGSDFIEWRGIDG